MIPGNLKHYPVSSFIISPAKFINEVTADPFYSKANMTRLRKAIKDAKSSKNMTEHELIEADDD